MVRVSCIGGVVQLPSGHRGESLGSPPAAGVLEPQELGWIPLGQRRRGRADALLQLLTIGKLEEVMCTLLYVEVEGWGELAVASECPFAAAESFSLRWLHPNDKLQPHFSFPL